MKHVFALLAVLAVLTTGCRKATTTIPDIAPELPPVQNFGEPVTEAEAYDVGKIIEKAWNEKDLPTLGRYMNMEKIMRRGVADMIAINKSFEAGFMNAIRNRGSSEKMLMALLPHADSTRPLTFLRSRQSKNGTRTFVARMINNDGGLTYDEFYLGRDEKNQIVVLDIYVLIVGEMFSETMRSSIYPLLAQSMNENDNTSSLAELNKISEFTLTTRTGQHEVAYQQYLKLPEKTRKLKAIQLLAIVCLSEIPTHEKEYLKLVEDYYLLHSDDPSSDLVTLDYFVNKQNVKQVQAALKRINTWCGGDDYLQVIEASFFLTLGQTDEAKHIADRVAKNNPTYGPIYDVLILIDLANKDWPAAKTHFELLIIHSTDAYDFDALKKTEPYVEFAKTPQFKEVQEFHKKNRK